MSTDPEAVTDSGSAISLENPFKAAAVETARLSVTGDLERGAALRALPFHAAGEANRQRQHLKDRMTVWERIRFFMDEDPHVLYQNWGPNLDGASLVTAIISIDGRDVVVYGHDFTVRAGSMDATNGKNSHDCSTGGKAAFRWWV